MHQDKQSLSELIAGCLQKQRYAQKMLYQRYYALGMGICLRYANDEDEAITMLNDGFLKIFRKLDRYDSSRPFEPWLRTLLVRSSLDFLRKKNKHMRMVELQEAKDHTTEEDFLANLSYQELIGLIQNLSLGYRTVFNMFAIDGYSHEEIAAELGISVGTSKSNLSRARMRLREIISKKIDA